MIEISRDGMAFLVMGYKGPKAAKFKEAYISAFNYMEGLLRRDNIGAISQVTERLASLEQAIEKMGDAMTKMWSNFGVYSTVSAFVHACCVTGHSRMYTEKAELYEAYKEFCKAEGRDPEGRSHFFHKVYTGITGTYSSTRTWDGKRVPVIRGLELLLDYTTIIDDLTARHEREMKEELARRRQFYFGIKSIINQGGGHE